MIDLGHWSDEAGLVITAGAQRARARGAAFASPLDLLAALVGDGAGHPAGVFTALNVDVPELTRRVHAAGAGGAFPGPDAERFAQMALDEALLSRRSVVDVEHLLLALLQTPAASILTASGITPAALQGYIAGVSSRRQAWERPLSFYKGLAPFARDVTEQARLGQLDPVVGRDAEIGRLLHILNRRQKNNPVLIGAAGVGKTAIVEGLAQRIAAGHVPEPMRYRRVVALNLTALVAGTRARGQFEERLQGILEDIQGAEGDLLIFVDEIHMMVGAGASDGGFDFAGVIKPALARGEIRMIGATTTDEYRRIIERDAALERRFSPIWVAEPTHDHAIAILRGLRPRYQDHHGVAISDGAITAAVRLSSRYISGRQLPDKAVDLLDEAASMVALDHATMPVELARLESGTLTNGAAHGTNGAGNGRGLPRAQRNALLSWLRAASTTPMVTEAEVAALVASMTGIPVTRVLENEAARLLRLEDQLRQRVVGQDRAVHALAAAVRRARSGLGDPQRPIGSFIFLGPSGVGKTELARALAWALFDDAGALIQLDMSEYMERHNVSRLFGAPPGYVGYDDSGSLTELVRRRPYRVVLFDEIEKAHPDVWNALLQILDAGRMTDGHGRVVDFRNTVIIMTSNLGTSHEQDSDQRSQAASVIDDQAWLEEQVEATLKKTFRPEFRNRVDEIIIFNPLDEKQLTRVLELQLTGLRAALGARGLSLTISSAARRVLLQEGYSPAFGARHLRRTIHRWLTDVLASELLRGQAQPGDLIEVGYRGGRYHVRVKAGERPQPPEPVEASPHPRRVERQPNRSPVRPAPVTASTATPRLPETLDFLI